MAKYVDLSNLPRVKRGVDWSNCYGKTVKCHYDGFDFEVTLKEYDKTKQYINFEYNGGIHTIKTSNFISCKLRSYIPKEFDLKIGEVLKDDKRDLTIINIVKEKQKDGYNKTYYKCRCNICGYETLALKGNLKKGRGCAACCNQVAVLGINTIWDTDRWMVDLGVSEEDAKTNTYGSNKEIEVVCPDCGCRKMITPNALNRNKSISCDCSDGKSFPEKFMMNVLKQLNVDFQIQLTKTTFKWCEDKKYDFYIPSLNMIIETHGRQHYEDTNWVGAGGRTLAEEQENDRIKKELALNNKITEYIVIDCRYSKMEWIKGSVLNSRLSDIFNLSKIDWLECERFALGNLVKEVCKKWEEFKVDMTIPVFAKFYPEISDATVREYIKKGSDLGWTTYNAKEELKRSSWKNLKVNRKTVYVYKNEELKHVFNSCLEASVELEKIYNIQFHKSGIATYCREGKPYKGFTFKYATEIEKEQNNLKESV